MLDLHYWPTPNGKKVTIQLEECGLEYNVVEPVISVKGAQFTDAFLKHQSQQPHARTRRSRSRGTAASPLSVFESGAIMLYMAEKDRSVSCRQDSSGASFTMSSSG